MCKSLSSYKSDACASTKTSTSHQSLESKHQNPPLPLLFMSLTFFYLSLPVSVYVPRSIHVRLMWRSGLVPALSPWNSWFQLGPLLGPYVHVHMYTHTHAHTGKEWGGLLSLAQRSVEGVIESFDQNIGGAVKRPALAVVTALCLSIRLGWSSSRSA